MAYENMNAIHITEKQKVFHNYSFNNTLLIAMQKPDKLDPVTGDLMFDENGMPQKEEVEVSIPAFRAVSVFDVNVMFASIVMWLSFVP